MKIPLSMGQEAGKLAWPRPTGGYRTIMRRRYRRRHAYASFRPSLNSQDRHERQQDREGSSLENVQTGSSSYSNPSAEVPSGLLNEPVLENTGAGEPVCESVLSQTSEADTSPFSLFSYGLEDNQISGNLMNTYENSEALAGYASGGSNDLNGQNGIAFVNIDSYKPDSSDGEENDGQETFSLAREVGLFQEALGNLLSELEGGIESFTELQSQLPTLNHSVSRECCEEAGPMPLTRYFSIDSDLACPNNMTLKPSAEDQAIPKSSSSDASYETQQIKTVDVGIGTPAEIANELNVDGNTAQGNSSELVVRPKIRKQNTANKSEREKLLPSEDEEEGGSWRKTGITEVQQGRAEYALRNSKERRSMFFDSRDYEGDRKNTKIDQRKNSAAQEQKITTFWDEFEDCSRCFSMTLRDEDSSDYSDGEWSPVVPAYLTATEKEESSSDESWESAPGKEEHGPEEQSNNSGVEEQSDFCCQGGEQTVLEEEEIPWLQYREEVESSSDEENYPFSDFLHPIFFLLDGNNNFEDDSSVSEDLDVEWRLLDEFGDGLGLAQAIPYMNPHFLTIMALEGRLQQAMEILLIYLETLGFDVEQAHPPATKETIDCLPQITVTDDQDGQEQRCTICCSEYVKDEIITELPCHHLFHKTCITLWLQKFIFNPCLRKKLPPLKSIL
uniref:RING-type domain-containing protein n=1 Tax=Accipiter nisus TaxID=211598 RepID=A0A8B9P1J5_9AVES